MGKDSSQNSLQENEIQMGKISNHNNTCNNIPVKFLANITHVETYKKLITKNKIYNTPKLKKLKSQLYQKFKKFIHLKQEIYENNCGSSCDFICPICLEMFIAPCPTSCGHIFCFRCIDESLIRKGTCPSCRNFIRNQQFIESKPFSQMCHYFWMTSKQKEQYMEKLGKNEEWLKSRRIDVENLKINDMIDARDTEHIWCKAKIIDIYRSEDKIDFLVHFEGWNEIYDEVINSKSQRLAPCNFFSSREDIPRYRLNMNEDNIRSRIDYRQPQVNQQIPWLFTIQNNALDMLRSQFRTDAQQNPIFGYLHGRIGPQPIIPFGNFPPMFMRREPQLSQSSSSILPSYINHERSQRQQSSEVSHEVLFIDDEGSEVSVLAIRRYVIDQNGNLRPNESNEDEESSSNGEDQQNSQDQDDEQGSEHNPLSAFEEYLARRDEQQNNANNSDQPFSFNLAPSLTEVKQPVNLQIKNQREVAKKNEPPLQNIGAAQIMKTNEEIEQRISDSQNSQQLQFQARKHLKRASIKSVKKT